MKPILFLLAILASLVAATAAPSFIVILADDMGQGDLSCYNPASAWKTPHLDRLAAEGLRFDDAHSPSSVCTPTRYGLLTGRYAWRSRLKQGVLGGTSPSLIETGRPTLASALAARGYRTAVFGKWHLGLDWQMDGQQAVWDQPFAGGPLDHGFGVFHGLAASLDMTPYVFLEGRKTAEPVSRTLPEESGYRFVRSGPQGQTFELEQVQPTLIEKTIAFLHEHRREHPDRPFFIYVPLASPHTPIVPNREFQGRTPTPYGDFCVEIDHGVGLILAALRDTGADENTFVVFAADNGCSPTANLDELKKHGHDSTLGRRGHKSDLYEGGHRVPFLVRWPAGLREKGVTTQLTCLTDLYRTFAELAGADVPDTAAEDSHSFAPLFKERASTSPSLRAHAVHHSINGRFALRQGPWKLLMASGSGGWSPAPQGPDRPPVQLYHLDDDPAETRNLATEQPGRVREMVAWLRTLIENGRSTPGPRRENHSAPDWPGISWPKPSP